MARGLRAWSMLSRVRYLANGGILLAACAVVSPCLAERSTFVTNGPEQGLTDLDGTALVADRAGDILLATEHGVFAYDGRRFDNLGSTQGLRDGGEVFGLAVSSGGLVGIEYPGEIYVSDTLTDTSHPVTSLHFRLVSHPGLTFYSERPHQFAAWHGGFVFIADDQIVRISTSPNHVSQVESLPYDRAEQASLAGAASVFAVDGNLWATFDDGHICAADPGSVRCYGAADGVTTGPWRDLVSDRHGGVIARSSVSIATLASKDRKWNVTALPDQGSVYDADAPDLGLYRTPDGLLITQSQQGLDILKPDGWHELTVADGAPSGVIVGALTDTTGQLWFRVLGRGLVRWVGYGHWDTVERSDGLSAGYAWETARAPDGSLWVTADGGVDQLTRDGASLRVSRVYPGASYPLAADSSGEIWAGWRNKGLREIDPSTSVTTILPMPPVETIVPDPGYGTWIGTDAGLYKMPADDRAPFHPQLAVRLRAPISSIEPDQSGGVFFLCAGRLRHLYSDGRVIEVSDPWPLGSLEPLAMARASDGSFWIGGPGGLLHAVIQNDRIKRLTAVPTDDIRSSTVYAVMVDHRGWVWVGTDQGVSVFDGARWVSVDATNGLLSSDVNEDGIREDPDGSVFIVTSHGISHLRDPSVLFRVLPLSVVVTSATLGSSPVANNDARYTRDPLSVELGTPNHGAEQSVLFRYRLEGVDTNWVTSTTGQIRFPFVPPGRHRLTVIGYDVLTHRTSAPAYLMVDVGYPWWRQWWAESLFAAAILALFYGAMRFRYRMMYVRQAELRRHVADATLQIRHQAAHDQLTGLLTRHETELRLAEILQAGDRCGELVVALLDVDHFKQINDNFGHLGGDDVLRALGRVVRRSVLEGEFAGRYGGEEILLVLGDADGHAAERILRLHLAIRHDTFNAASKPIRVTCSIGVAWASLGDSWESVLGRADAALYEAKGAGRDRVVESRTGGTVHGADLATSRYPQSRL